jgi:prepilin-type N-terminal cleavage/methylation domain-containing protein
MWGVMKRNKGGFTLFEIIAVLMLISIIAATVLGRGINTEQTDLTAQMDKIRNHFRYAQSMALKNGDQVWGFRCVVGPPHEYWIFRLDVPVGDPVNDPDNAANQVQLPGENNIKVSLSQAGVTMDAFTIFFDKYGIPYYTDVNVNKPLAAIESIDVSAGSITRSFSISPETGLIQ